ncbi:prepilin peptidase [Patescibacteria group bacterium]|nr:prepilin peptidase [Patescibacteria group bacterium]MBU4481356.1 prepilin peptidase [Patescibacteria group bacterium]
MSLIFYFFIFLLGLTVGSFLNSIIERLSKNETFLSGRSYCPGCKHILNWQDLIPIFSFLILRGKCRYCSQKISWQYPLVELTAGILFVLIMNYELRITNYELLNFETILNSLFLILTSCFLIIIFVYDLKHYIIPDKIVYPAIAAALIFNFEFLISKQFLIFNYLILSAVGSAAFFLFIVLISRGKWMGLGDVKLAFLMGLFLGWPKILVALFLAFFIGAIIGLGLIALGKKGLKSEVPFGPFLVSGTFIALFWGQEIVRWYISNFQFSIFNFQ